MKALELTVYPKTRHSASLTLYAVGRDTHYTLAGTDKLARDKRLADAELAAESYKGLAEHLSAVYEFMPGFTCERAYQIGQTLERFATLPHYDEKEMNA